MRCIGISLLLIIFFNSCKKEPLPVQPPYVMHILYRDIQNFHYPVGLTFYTDIKDAEQYHWDFGNSSTADDATSTAHYNESGQHLITLTVRKNGTVFTYSQMVDVPYIQKSVAALYIIIQGQSYNPTFKDKINLALPLIQQWYKQQTGGKTFHLNNPVSDTIYSQYSYFSSTDDAIIKLKDELTTRLRMRLDWQGQDVIIFIPGVLPSNTAGVSQENLKGERIALVLESGCNGLLTDPGVATSWGTYVSAHELGHTFGLKHNNDLEALMWGPETGPPYIHNNRFGFPDCRLLEAEKQLIISNPYFFDN